VAVSTASGATPAQRVRLATVGAPYAVGLAGLEPAGEAAGQLGRIRALVAEVAGRGRMPGTATPVAECVLLYSAEADLWTGGRHRRAVELAAAALATHHVQAPVVLRLTDAPHGVAVVLAGAEGLTPLEAREVTRRLESGAGVLAFGAPSRVDEAGRELGGFLPAGKPGGVKLDAGTLAQLPPLVPESGSEVPVDQGQLEKALSALLGKGRRAVGVTGRARLSATLWKAGDQLDVHLATLGPERSQGNTLFLGLHVVGAARKARFQSAEGADVEIRLNPSGYSVSTILPAFAGYAVLTLQS